MPEVNIGRDSVQGADAAPQLHGDGQGLAQAPDGVQVLGPGAEGAVQVHHVEELGPGRLPLKAHGRGVVAEDGDVLGPPLAQAHALAVFEVNGRNNQHNFNILT